VKAPLPQPTSIHLRPRARRQPVQKNSASELAPGAHHPFIGGAVVETDLLFGHRMVFRLDTGAITSRGDRTYIDRMVKDSSQDSSIVTLRPRRPDPILVCRKCLKRVADGKQIKRALKSEVKRRSAAQATKRPRIVLTDCLGICPKRAVVLASGTTLHRGEYLLLAGQDEIGAAAAILMQPDRP
jgi:hypothetical protein